MPKKGEKVSYMLDGRKVFQPKIFTGRKFYGWVGVKYKKVRLDSGYFVFLKLHNGEDISVQKSRSEIIKSKKLIWIEPNYYETTHKRFVEKVQEINEE